jgi:NADH-quinone oxidoreductase subunit D
VQAPPVSGDEFLEDGPFGDPQGLVAETSEGPQELNRRSETEPSELRREVGAVLRLPEGVAIDPSDIDIEQSDDETMIINMGPQHPSTHGVLRLMLELDGETVLRTKPVIGYLHTGMEKTGEELTYVQGSTNVTRMDYLAPSTTNWCCPWRWRRCSVWRCPRARTGSAC